MIDKLIQLSKNQLSDTLTKKENLSSSQVNDTFNLAKGSFLDTLKDQALSGNLSQIKDLFNGNTSLGSSISSIASKKLAEQLTSKLNLSQDQARSIANTVVPVLINVFSSKDTGTVNSSEDLLKLFGINTGNILGGLGSKLGGLFG
jgi:nucleoid DNA-binding protein